MRGRRGVFDYLFNRASSQEAEGTVLHLPVAGSAQMLNAPDAIDSVAQ
jgi:hypothetical protein